MLPIFLEPIAQAFPNLNIIIAHLGICYLQESATLARIIHNIYVDISGAVDGWRSNTTIDEFKKLFYWKTAANKILFGSDVHFSEIEETLNDHRRIFDGIGFSPGHQEKIFYQNSYKLLYQNH